MTQPIHQRECPGCDGPLDAVQRHIACPSCWTVLPEPLKRALREAWAARRIAHGRALKWYVDRRAGATS